MESVIFEVKDSVAVLTLNRPEVLNSFNVPMGAKLCSYLDQCEKDDSIRAIYLTGNGKGFCAGQDLQEAIADDGPGFDKILDSYNGIIKRIRQIEKPVICAVNGVAAGAGANIALACDITFAISSAKFVQAFSSIGLIPDSGGTYYLPRLIGQQKAAAIMYSGEKIMAEDAEKMGMIYKSVEDLSEAWTMATKMASRPTFGIGLTKKALNASVSNSLDQQLALEKELQLAASSSVDYNEGVAAFLEKRRPKFIGQ